MYDYVRRQQELQPSMFTTKTFQWMDQSVREPSWVKRYSKTGPMDPLAYSSSSLFTGQRSTSRLGGTLGVFHRSAVSLTPHRALFAFRRHRLNSDAAVRPPSGVASSFRSRRRGFTAPPGTQPPPASPLFAAAVILEKGDAGAAALVADAAPASPFSRKTAANPHGLADAPIKEHASPQSTALIQRVLGKSSGSVSKEAGQQRFMGGGDSGGANGDDDHQRRPPADRIEKADAVALGDMAFPFTQPTSSSQPQLFSSFSPPNSPHPHRTLCHRARQLMNRVRSTRPAAAVLGAPTQMHFSPAHQQRHQHGLQKQQQQQFPELHAPRKEPANPHRITSVLCVPTKNTYVDSDDDDECKAMGPGPDAEKPPATPVVAAVACAPMASASPPRTPLSAAKQPRLLPRSPLANPAVLPEADEAEDPPSSSGSDTEPGGAFHIAKPVSAESSASSSDDDGLTCRACNRYRGLEWIVGCNNDHHLCFGCVQAHVKHLLASTDAFRVPCPLSRCDAHIPGKYLRDCLPPQRMQQLAANRKRSSRPARALTRYFSLDGRKDASAIEAGAQPANASDEGFDAPVVVVDNSSFELNQPILTDQQRINNGAMLNSNRQPLERTFARALRADPQRHSASMPSLPQACYSPGSPEADTPAALFMSELTKVSTEKGSVSSVVLAASVAADSGLSLSPQSVGSRLRRIPKVPRNLNADLLSIGGSPEAVTAEHLELLSPSLEQRVFMPPTSIAPEDIDRLQTYAGQVYDYTAVNFDTCMQTPPPRQSHAMSFASSSSPISWQSPIRPAGDQRRHRHVPSIICPKQQPEAPPPLPLQFRASATWITPEQRHSGYAENILLSATLFETIRRKSTPSEGDDSDDDYRSSMHIAHTYAGQRNPVPMIPATPCTPNDDDNDDDESAGVYIPTWRRPNTAIRNLAASPWDDFLQYGSQSGILCEAAELNFDLYETLHRRR